MNESMFESRDDRGYVNDSLAVSYKLNFKKVSKTSDADMLIGKSNRDGLSYVEIVSSGDDIYKLKIY